MTEDIFTELQVACEQYRADRDSITSLIERADTLIDLVYNRRTPSEEAVRYGELALALVARVRRIAEAAQP
jgi:hypothetical protein